MKHGDIKWNRQWDKQTLVQLLTDCYRKAKAPFTLNIFSHGDPLPGQNNAMFSFLQGV